MTNALYALSDIPPKSAALFLDFDGTLVDIASGPDAIDVPENLVPLLASLMNATGGALAMITGRSIANVTAHLPLPPRWIAGCHGGERRTPGDQWTHPLTNSAEVKALCAHVAKLCAQDGVVLEAKPLGVAIHYRNAPDREAQLRETAAQIIVAHPAFEWHPAKMALEFRPRDVGKEHVVKTWMSRSLFQNRTPIYIGDDLTDEPAMSYVQNNGGRAIKVGAGDTAARVRLRSPQETRDMLTAWCAAR